MTDPRDISDDDTLRLRVGQRDPEPGASADELGPVPDDKKPTRPDHARSKRLALTSALDDSTAPKHMTHGDRVRIFGAFAYTHYPIPGNAEHIDISHDWDRENIVRVTVPGNTHFAARATRVHKLVVPQFQALLEAWQAANLFDRVLTYNGGWAPRFKRQRGSYEERVAKCKQLGAQALSNHAWGTAFDLNAPWNRLGHVPAALGQTGCVRELVGLAEQHGFAWGGDWHTPDGMHFECFEVRS